MNKTGRLLICDDDKLDRMAVLRELRYCDFEFIECASANQAFESLKTTPVDCVLLDLRMPDIDGLTALKTILREQLTTAPIIMLSGLDDEDLATQCLQFGAQDYIIKSTQKKDALLRCIRHARERKTLELDLQIAVQKAETANEAKSEFLANISHELRTPLNSLLILSNSWAKNSEGNLTTAQIEEAHFIHQGGLELLDLINDLLDLSKAEAGLLSIYTSTTTIRDISAVIANKFAPVAKQKSIPLITEIAPDTPLDFTSDAKRILQILNNFLSNAFKFTQKGQISLRIFQPELSVQFDYEPLNQGGVVAFAVSDTGIGISEEKQTVIFEAFRQEDGSTERRYGGTGLGLTIARKLATLLGGEITLSSTQGVGSTFTLYLPLVNTLQPSMAVQDSIVETPQSNETTATDLSPCPTTHFDRKQLEHQKSDEVLAAHDLVVLRGKRALLVDDDVRHAFVLSALLSKAGLETTIADSGQLAVEKASLCDYDIILIEITMSVLNDPVINGYEATKQIRTIDRMSKIPIIALSADPESTDWERCRCAGASEYLPKPFDTDQLLSLLTTCFKEIV